MKRVNLEMVKGFKKVGTHNGVFHGDDVLASTILLSINKDLEIVRSRNDKDLSDCDMIYDVSLSNEVSPYDHHFEGRELRPNGIPYSSAGLIWRDLGEDYLSDIIDFSISQEDIHGLWKKIDHNIIEGVDAIDNGVDCQGKYEMLSVSKIISYFTPSWEEGISKIDSVFFDTVSYVCDLWNIIIEKELSSLRAKSIVKEAYDNSTDGILVLPRFVPWKELLLNIDVDKKIKFVTYNDGRQQNLYCVPKEIGKNENIIDIPEPWRGKNDEELSIITGVNDCVFCHIGGFMISHKNLEGCLKLAKKIMEVD